MPFIGQQPAPVALTSSDITDGIISEAKMADDAIGLPELKAGTDGQIISWDASGNPVAISVGSSGEFLKSQGAGSQPVFAAAGGVWTFIKSQTADDATSVDFAHGTSDVVIDTTYYFYKLIGTHVEAKTDAKKVQIQFSVDAGSSYDTAANYATHLAGVTGAGSTHFRQWHNGFAMYMGEIGTSANEKGAFEFNIFDPSNTTNFTAYTQHGTYMDAAGGHASFNAAGQYNVANNVDGFRLIMNTGNISGTFKLYGLKGS
jgi:hypothetical protein